MHTHLQSEEAVRVVRVGAVDAVREAVGGVRILEGVELLVPMLALFETRARPTGLELECAVARDGG